MKKSVRVVFLFCAMVLISGGLNLLVGGTNVTLAHATSSKAIPIDAHYLALGDSAAFGYQPNGDFQHGYANDLFINLQKSGAKDITNLACLGETSTTFFIGGCPFAPKGSPSQLVTAMKYLIAHPGTVDPITLQVGANDVLPAIDVKTCAINGALFTSSLKTLDNNLKSILAYLNYADGSRADILLMNYYDPFQNICPNTVSYIQTLNQHLANDVVGYGKIVDNFAAFGGATVPNPNICNYTWICSTYADIHPTIWGYVVMMGAIDKAMSS